MSFQPFNFGGSGAAAPQGAPFAFPFPGVAGNTVAPPVHPYNIMPPGPAPLQQAPLFGSGFVAQPPPQGFGQMGATVGLGPPAPALATGMVAAPVPAAKIDSIFAEIEVKPPPANYKLPEITHRVGDTTVVRDLTGMGLEPLKEALQGIADMIQANKTQREANMRKIDQNRQELMATLRAQLEDASDMAARLRKQHAKLNVSRDSLRQDVDWVYKHTEQTYNRADMVLTAAHEGQSGVIALELPADFLVRYASERGEPRSRALLTRLSDLEGRVSALHSLAQAQASSGGSSQDVLSRLLEVIATMRAALAAVDEAKVRPLGWCMEDVRRRTMDVLQRGAGAGMHSGLSPSFMHGHVHDPFIASDIAATTLSDKYETDMRKTIERMVAIGEPAPPATAPSAAVGVAAPAATTFNLGGPSTTAQGLMAGPGQPAAATAAPLFNIIASPVPAPGVNALLPAPASGFAGFVNPPVPAPSLFPAAWGAPAPAAVGRPGQARSGQRKR